MTSLLFRDTMLHDTAMAQLKDDIPLFEVSPQNPYLTKDEKQPEASHIEVEITEGGILISSDTGIDISELIRSLKDSGIETTQIGVNLCG